MPPYSDADRLSLALAAAKLGDWSWDAATDIVTFSARAAEVFQIPAGPHMTWTAMRELLHPDDAERARVGVENALANRTDYNIEYRLVNGTGERWVSASGRGVYDPAGAVVGMLGVVQDITERVRVRDTLRQQERAQAYLAAIVDSADDAIVAKNLDGIIQSWNAGAERVFGYRASEMVGKPVRMLIPPERQSEEDAILARLRRGERVDHFETVRVRKDGTHVHVSLTVSPVRASDGTIIGASKIARDITAQKHAAAALAAQQEWFRVTLGSIGDAVIACDPHGAVTFVNATAETLTGWSHDDAVGRALTDVFDIVNETTRVAVEDPASLVMRLGHVVGLANHTVLIAKDGTERPIADSAAPIRDATGTMLGVVLVFRDVSDERKSQLALEEQRRWLETTLESITDAFCALDRDWRFTYVNRQAEVLLGRDRGTLLGKNHWEEYPDTAGSVVETSYRRALAEQVTVTFEFFYQPHDRWYDVHAYPSLEGLAVYFRDVSDRKKSEIVLRDSESRFRELADAMPQIVWTADGHGRIDYLNRRWSEFTGEPASVSNDAWGSLLHPDDAALAGERWAASTGSGEPFEMQLRLLDRRNDTYRWHLIRTVAVRDEAGRISRWFGTATDIHQQKAAESSLRFLAEISAELASVADYEATLQKLASLSVPYFADWSAVDLSEPGGLRRLAVAHQDPMKIAVADQLMRDYPPDPSAPAGMFAVLRTGKPMLVSGITDEMLVESAVDQRHLTLLRSLGLKAYICVPLIVSGQIIGVLTFATAESGRTYTNDDLSLAMDLARRASVAVDNTKLYQALREADRRKDEFLATLAHELRNPLAPIRNALEILRMPRVAPDTQERARAMMERQVHHVVRLVDDLLDVSRVMGGKIELRREPVELAAIVARAVETVQPLIDAQQHELRIKLPSESMVIEADTVRLSQVISNLLTNSAKYTDPGGRISLSAQREQNTVVLRVRDNGIGLDPAMRTRIFDLFVQAELGTTRSQGGLGIGLTLARNLVEMHDGSIEAVSRGIGHGSEFIVRLPLAHGIARTEIEPPDAPAAEPPARQKTRVLVVDDNTDAAESLAILMGAYGHEVRVASSGAAALELVKTFVPDIAFLDIGMPTMDGYELARRLRAQPALKDIVLVALTGWGQQEDRRRSAEAGFAHHVVKPPEPEALAALIDSVRTTRDNP
ncbi:MAG TPA: PAS domain S-box protein [Vicinamibacterales bacterium]|nr:PAS domain S-box protein [Vicinamibacterales bacterium]